MTCLRENDNGADLLIGYLEGTLVPAQRRELEEHAEGCAECGEMLAVQQTLDDFPVPVVSPGFDAQLYARIAEDAARPRWWETLWRPALPLAAATMLAAGVLWVRTPEPVEAPKQATNEILELEQVLEDLELLMPATDNL